MRSHITEDELSSLSGSFAPPFAQPPTACEMAEEFDDHVPHHAEDSLALEFAKRYGCSLRFTFQWGKWLWYDGPRWVQDDKHGVFTEIRKLCRQAAAIESANQSLSKKIASASTVAAVERLSRYIEPHQAVASQWDADPWLLNTPGGAIGLKLGTSCAFELRPGRAMDYCTKMTAATPGGTCPTFNRFLAETTGGDAELQRYLQMVFGYCLTGDTREQVMFDIFGPPGTGKTTITELMSWVMGSYALSCPVEVFLETKNDRHSTELARLEGARLLTTTETSDGRFLAESRINSVTGGEPITARRMRMDDTTFFPQFKLMVVGNYKPRLKNPNGGVQRRMRLLPLTHTVAVRDPHLPTKLRAESSGILQWAIDGCRLWQQAGGLPSPKVVNDATGEYLADEDALGRWLDERTEPNLLPTMAASADLYGDYRTWADDGKEFSYSAKRFALELESRGYTNTRTKYGRGFVGLKLRATQQ